MIDTDKLGFEAADLGDNRSDHVGGFFAALSQVLPKRARHRSLGGIDIDDDIGGGTGGTFAKVNYLFDGQKKKGEDQEKNGGSLELGLHLIKSIQKLNV